MDQMTNDFAQLSTTAREWTPSSMQSQQQGTSAMLGSSEWNGGDGGESGLNAKTVKEFVPGQGWRTASHTAGTMGTSASPAGTSVVV
eukprot:scaffold405_cov132-Cylindrotheca_fusiformis.AAC.20